MTDKSTVSPMLAEAVRLLADGQWHKWDEISAQLERFITPGRAIRKAEDNRRNKGPAERAKPRTVEELVRSGRLALIRDVVRAPNFEIRPSGRQPTGVVREVRMVSLPRRAIAGRPTREPESLVKDLRAAAPDGIMTPELRAILLLCDRPEIEAALLHVLQIKDEG